MSESTPSPVEAGDPRLTQERYFGLVAEGVLHPEDKIELLEGVVVAMAPQSPRHAAGTSRSLRALSRVVGDRATIRIQMPLMLGQFSVPEPDIAVVPGRASDYDRAHPTTALLVVEVADTSLAQDRITKTRIYAAAGIPEVWIINLRDDCLEVFQEPNSAARNYEVSREVGRGERVAPRAFADATVAVEELLPARE